MNFFLHKRFCGLPQFGHVDEDVWRSVAAASCRSAFVPLAFDMFFALFFDNSVEDMVDTKLYYMNVHMDLYVDMFRFQN